MIADHFHVWLLWRVLLPVSNKFVPITALRCLMIEGNYYISLAIAKGLCIWINLFTLSSEETGRWLYLIPCMWAYLVLSDWAQELVSVQCLVSKGILQLKSKEMENSLYCLAQHSKVMPCFPNEFVRLRFPAISSSCVISLLDKRDTEYPVFVFSLAKCLHCIN